MELKNNLFKLVITPIIIIILLVFILSKNFFFDFNNNLSSQNELNKVNFKISFFEKYIKENYKLVQTIKQNDPTIYKNTIKENYSAIPNIFKKELLEIRNTNKQNKIDLIRIIEFNNFIKRNIKLNSFSNIRNKEIQKYIYLYSKNIEVLTLFNNIYLLFTLGNDDNFLDYQSYFNLLKNLKKEVGINEYKGLLDVFEKEDNHYYYKNNDLDNYYFNKLNELYKLNKIYYSKINKLLLDDVHYIQQVGFFFFFIISIFIVLSFSLYNTIKEKLVEEDEISTLRKNIINNDIIYSETDLKGIITYTSNYFEKISGYSKEELIGQPHNIIRHPDMSSEIFKEIWDTISSGNKWEGIVKNRNKSGEAYYVSSSIFPIYKNGEHIGYASSREDVTTLILEEKKSSKIYDALNTIVINTDGENIKSFNNKFYDYFNYNSFEDFKQEHDCICELFVEVEGKDYLLSDYKGMRWAEYLLKHQNTEEVFKVCMEDKYLNKKVFRVKLVPDISVSNYIIIFIDITNIENQSDMLLQQAKFSTMGEMVGMIAHQWRQPLSTLNGMFLPLLLKQQMGINISEKELKERVDKQKEIVVYLSDTIEDFLNFTRVDDNFDSDTIENSIFKPYRLLENTYKDLKINFNVSYENCKKKNIVKTKHNKFNQILLNLYKNSIDEFKKKKIKNPEISVEVQDLGNKIEYLVSDNAGGIPEEIIGKIFNPYFSTKSKNGTGVGLYMSKVIAQNHLNGSINVYNNDKGGVSFLIYIKKN